MDSDLYRSAKEGTIDAFRGSHEQLLCQLLTQQKNTVLHIYITASTTDETEFVAKILEICPSLLLQANASGETPLHLAARYGHTCIAKLLIEHARKIDDSGDIETSVRAAREMLRMTTNEKDTALHEAVRFGHLSVVQVLAEEDSDHTYSANEAGETPLYMAAERGYLGLVRLILEKFTSPLAAGPNNRTALHAATIRNHNEMVRMILGKMVHLSGEADEKGWVPLHYAAEKDQMLMVNILLSSNKSALYVGDVEGRTPLHTAAYNGFTKIMKKMYGSCPDCYELVDNRGRNVLHFAVQSNEETATKFILKDASLSYLLNGKDDEGNIPLHFITRPSIAQLYLSNSRADKLAYNKQNKNSLDLAVSNNSYKQAWFASTLITKLRKGGLRSHRRITTPLDDDKDEEKADKRDGFVSKINKAVEASLITATLIATVTFAAGIAMPGSYVTENESDQQGTAILKNNTAFQVFIVNDMLAFLLSSRAVLGLLYMPFKKNKKIMVNSIVLNHQRIFYAMGTMVLAFVSLMYAVLDTPIAVAISVFSLCIFFNQFFIFCRISFIKIFKSGSLF